MVQDTALPTLRHRFESGTMLQFDRLCPRSLMEERFASNELGVGSSPIGGPKHCRLPIGDWSFAPGLSVLFGRDSPQTNCANRKSAIGNRKYQRGSVVAGNLRVFQTRIESSNLSFRSKSVGQAFLPVRLLNSKLGQTRMSVLLRASPSG